MTPSQARRAAPKFAFGDTKSDPLALTASLLFFTFLYVETAAHEIGHNLHTTLYGGNAKTPKEQARNIESALRPYLDELKLLAHYEPWGMEGFAEFTRLYVTNPDVAKELAPKFYNKFEADLEAQYPDMKNALLEARDYYDQYLQGTPQSRIRAQTNYANDKGKLANIIVV